MRNNPIGWSYSSAVRQLHAAGFVEVSGSGSHRTWKHADDPRLYTVQDPGGNRRVKPGYIRMLVKRIDRLRSDGGEDGTP
jgi:predicted RNA binding protein YcfA (HicA-like mRNA interferase family)